MEERKNFYDSYKEISETEMFKKRKQGMNVRIVDHKFEPYHDVTVSVCDEDKTVCYERFYIGE